MYEASEKKRKNTEEKLTALQIDSNSLREEMYECGSGDSSGRGGCDQLLGFGTRDQNAFADFEGHAAELGMRQHVLHGASGGQLADGLFEVGDVGLRFGGDDVLRQRDAAPLEGEAAGDLLGFARLVERRDRTATYRTLTWKPWWA